MGYECIAPYTQKIIELALRDQNWKRYCQKKSYEISFKGKLASAKRQQKIIIINRLWTKG